MDSTVVIDLIKHGRQMYLIGLEHAITMFKLAGSEVIEALELKAKAEREVIKNLEHSRHNEEHYKQCQSCYGDHLDFQEEMRIDAQDDERVEDDENTD